jgi:hypothetical protein
MNANSWPQKAEIGIFWTWGNWDNLNWYDYLTTNTIEQLGDNNLYGKWCTTPHRIPMPHDSTTQKTSNFMLFLN